MTQLQQYVCLLGAHFFADFHLQTHWQASNKSKRLDALAMHVAVYTCVLFVVTPFIFEATLAAAAFVLANGALHFATDFFTSRWSARQFRIANDSYWSVAQREEAWHNFFAVIGFDQLLHQAALAATMMVAFG